MRRVFAPLFILAGAAGAIVTAESLQPDTLHIASLPEALPLLPGKAIESGPFGGDSAGHALWLSANGRYAALFRLTEDTNRNGELDIAFGQHGESWGDELMLDVFDIETGQHQRYDDLLSSDVSQRYAVLARGDDTWLFDSADGSARNLRDLGGGAAPDANRCMTPRQIVFDATGEHIALLRDEPAELVIVSVATGKPVAVHALDKPLWRVEFTADPGRLLAIEATGEFPVQRTSCVSRSRRAFAASYSISGFDAGQIVHAFLDANGKRHGVRGAPVLLDGSAYLLPETGTLMRFTDDVVRLPAGCSPAGGADGSRVAVLGCGESRQLLDPLSGARVALPFGESLEFIEGTRVRGTGGTWYGVTLPISGNAHVRKSLGRLRLEDLRLERGPAVFFQWHTRHPDWITGGRVDDYFLMNIADGTVLTTRAKDTEARYDTLALRSGDRTFLLLDPGQRLQVEVRADIGIGNGRGCFLAAAHRNGRFSGELDRGPWTRHCVSKLP